MLGIHAVFSDPSLLTHLACALIFDLACLFKGFLDKCSEGTILLDTAHSI